MTEKRGRKLGGHNKEKKDIRDSYLNVRCYSAEKYRIQEMAREKGLTVSKFILGCVFRVVRK